MSHRILVTLSASVSTDKKDKEKLLYDHTAFNEATEVVIKMLDRLDRFDRIFTE